MLCDVIAKLLVFLDLFADVSSSSALPYDCIENGLTCCSVPEDSCFSLIGDTDTAQILRIDAQKRHTLRGHCQLRGPDLLGIVLHPARLGEDLPEFSLGSGADIAFVIEQDAAGTGGTLIQGHDIFHTGFSFTIYHNTKQDGSFRPFLPIYQSFQKLSSETYNKWLIWSTEIVEYPQTCCAHREIRKLLNLAVEISGGKEYNS